MKSVDMMATQRYWEPMSRTDGNPMRALFVFDTGEAWNKLGGKHKLIEVRIL